MNAVIRLVLAGVAALGLVIGMAHAAPPAGGDADDAAVRAYVPTDATFHGYLDATAAMAADGKHDAAFAAEVEKISDSNEGAGMSLVAGEEAIFARHPRYAAYFKRKGLTARDSASWAVLLPWMVMYVNPQPGLNPGQMMSAAQMQFAKAHSAEIKAAAANFAN